MYRSVISRHSVDSQKIAVRYIGRELTDSRSIYRSRFLSVCIVFSPLSIALEKKLEQDYWNINRLPPLTRGDSWKIRIFGHFSVSYEPKLLKIKYEIMPFFVVSAQTRTWRDEAGQSPIIKDVYSSLLKHVMNCLSYSLFAQFGTAGAVVSIVLL